MLKGVITTVARFWDNQSHVNDEFGQRLPSLTPPCLTVSFIYQEIIEVISMMKGLWVLSVPEYEGPSRK